MLYIFHVDTGTTITFDMKLALESVAQLKDAIERECGVAAGQQVLLVSGGESLEPNARVCTYSAGTDTNPIYLFSKASIESHHPPVPSIDYGSDVDLQVQIEASLAMPATYQTVVTRAQLGQQCCVLAREQTRICERLVHDQHLQQQGWAAVVANLEDITQMFQSRADLLQQSFTHYLEERQAHIELLNNFNEDLRMLSKIPILPALRAHAEGLLSPDDPESSELTTADAEPSGEALSLLKWISAKDNQSSLEQVAEQCSRGLEQFDERVMESLKSEVSGAVEAANKQDMKEIKGLGERLFGLEQLMFETKKLVQEQADLAQAFLQNQNRASNLGDASILPDLCASHRRQLMVMLQNHNHLRDIRRRCTKAKEELSVNLYQRLKWIMYVENKMMEVDGKLVMYHESLKRLRRHLEVLQQIHLAPEMYMSAVAEVVRRRTFSQAFLLWASNLACQLLTVHSEEIERRRDFQGKFDGHFLNTLFPGLEDTPPSFATQAPSVFDGSLPKLTSDDMQSLRETLPDLALVVSHPDLNSITQFFLSRSLTEGSNDGSKDKDAQMTADDNVKVKDKRRAPVLNDRGGFESETDTEEFEKIGQGALEMKRGNSYEAECGQEKDKQSEVGGPQTAVCGSRCVSSKPSELCIVNIKKLEVTNSAFGVSLSPNPALNLSNQGLIPSTRRQSGLSPLAESAESVDDSELSCALKTSDVSNELIQLSQHLSYDEVQKNPITNYSLTNNIPAACDGGLINLQQQSVGGNAVSASTSPSSSLGNGNAADFMGTEFYMDESLPSSLSEHPNDAHRAIVSLLQENLGNTREEVERLRSVLQCMKSVTSEAVQTFRNELASIRERTSSDKNCLTELTQGVRRALELHSRECDRNLREREQELTVDHELEMGDLKKLMEAKDEEIRSLNDTILEKESQRSENERLIKALKLKIDGAQVEFRNFQSRIIAVEEALERAHLEAEIAVKEAQDSKAAEISAMKNSLDEKEEEIRKLEETVKNSKKEQEEAVKAATDKFQKEYKTELDTIRSRFRLMAASSMERSPSDSSLEKIERPDVVEIAKHDTIVSQIREDLEVEKEAAIRRAIEKERTDCAAKLDHELRLARQRNDADRQVWFNEAMRRVIEEKERQVEIHRSRESLLSEDCERYKDTIRRLTESENMVRQTLSETVESLEADKVRLEANIEADRGLLKEQEIQLRKVEMERDKLIEKLGGGLEEAVKILEAKNERLESMKVGTDSRLQKLEAEKDKLKAELEIHRKNDDAEVSESKKVRLESEPSQQEVKDVIRKLESENKALKKDLRSLQDGKALLEDTIVGLEKAKGSLELEIKERSRRTGPASDDLSASAINPDPRDRDMSASVAVVPESSSRDAATSPEPTRRDPAQSSSHIRDRLTRSTANLIQEARISISSCNPGDVILVVWDTQYRNYILLQESSTLYFLHSDCVDALNLRASPDGIPKRLYAVAEVIDKEYCHARKPENRYRVPQGTKFYRVKVKPQQKDQTSASSQLLTSD